MAKYKVIWRDETQPWQEGCPLQIFAIQVSRDTEAGTCYLQLRVANISDKTVQSVEIQASVTDADGTQEAHLLQMLDADIPAGKSSSFSQQLEAREIANAEATIARADSLKSFDKAIDIPLPELAEYSEEEREERNALLVQEGILPDVYEGSMRDYETWWQCGCGSVNVGRDKCHSCGIGKSFAEQLDQPGYLQQALELDKVEAYAAALELMKSNKPDDQRKAQSEFNALGEFKDAADLAQKCDEALAAIAASKKKRLTKIGIAAAIVIVAIASAAPYAIYAYASSAADSGNYGRAYKLFKRLGDFNDSAERAQECGKDAIPDFSSVEVGDTVEFGLYEQDGDADNGSEPIRWKVLNITEHNALLVTESVLECMEYSSMSSWLEDNFAEVAFGDKARNIMDTPYSLNERKLRQYLPIRSERVCPGTTSCNENESTQPYWVGDSESYHTLKIGRYWHVNERAKIIDIDGEIVDTEEEGECGVRPAITVKLDKIQQ